MWYCVPSINEKVAQFLITARERTVAEGDMLLRCLEPLRQHWIKEFNGIEVTLKTSNGEAINGVHFPGTQKKAILFLHGNGCFYETSAERPLSWVRDLSTEGGSPHLLIFNPRGTGKSEGITHPKTVAEDFLIAFRYLVAHSVDPNHIIIAGHSMGGFFGAFGAALIQNAFPTNTIHCLSDRSFSNIYDRVDVKIQNCFQRAMMHCLIKLSQWDCSPMIALGTLKGRVCIIFHQQDEVIPYPTSLHASIKQCSRSYSYLELRGGLSPAHNGECCEAEYKQMLVEMKKMLGLTLEPHLPS